MGLLSSIKDYRLLRYHQTKASKETIRRYQRKALQNILSVAKEKSPYYQAEFKGLVFEDLGDLATFPTMDKRVLMEHFDNINTVNIRYEEALSFALHQEKTKDYQGYFQDAFVIGMSSGTSGNKGVYITPKALTKRLPAVFLSRSGLRLSQLPFRILFLLRVFSQGFDDINAPFIQLKYLSTMTDVTLIYETINKAKINILMAPPSMLRVMVEKSTLLNVKLKKIITYAEVLDPYDKAKFEHVFQTEVIEIYQASEGQMASSCSKGKLHINEDLVYVELLDEAGNIVDQPHVMAHKMLITNLVNEAQPLIRYQMNDLVILDDPCACGSAFRTIKQVLGRHDEVFYLPTKEGIRPLFPDLLARFIMTFSDDIREYYVIQDGNHITITTDGLAVDRVEDFKAHVSRFLREHDFNSTIEVRLESIELPKTMNKYRRFRVKNPL